MTDRDDSNDRDDSDEAADSNGNAGVEDDSLEATNTEDDTLEEIVSVPTTFSYDDGDHEPAHEPDDSAPLADLVSGIDSDRERSDEVEELFEREAVSDVDSDRLWEQVEGDDLELTAGVDREIREISKTNYCHGCEYFSRPPEVACLHEESEILELSTLETFRVADCPVVLGDEELERKY